MLESRSAECYVLSTDEAFEAYERCLYRAFTERHDDPWFAEFYEHIPPDRYRPPMPREHLLVLGVRTEGGVALGFCCFHLARAARFQVEALGFAIDKSPGTCEGLHLFSTEPLGGEEFLRAGVALERCVRRELSARGLERVYGSCGDRYLPLYSLFGFERLESKLISGVREHLLLYRTRDAPG